MSPDTWSKATGVARVAGWFGWALLGITLVAWIAKIWMLEHYADVIAAHLLEYAGGGSLKWRTPEGKELEAIAGALTFAYLTAPVAAVLLLADVAGSRTWRGRLAAAAGVALAIAANSALPRLHVPGVLFS